MRKSAVRPSCKILVKFHAKIFLTLIFLRKIKHLAALEALSRAEVGEVLLAASDLQTLKIALQKRNVASKDKYRQRKLASKPKTGPQKGICGLCKRPTPHRTKPEWQFHMLAAKRRWMQRAAHASWRRRGWEGLWKPSVASRYNRAIARRTAIFREIAPKSAAKMSALDIERVINQCRPGKTRWLNNLEKWKVWVRRRYA